MPGVRRKIAVGPRGPEKDAELVDVQQASEQWSQYLLADGSVIRLKPVVLEVWHILDEYDADGNPSYVVKSRNVMNVMAPDELRKPNE
jgi:hypothetical protein